MRKFRDAGVLLDAQLLLLLLVGEYDRQQVQTFKRTRSRTALEDLPQLRLLLAPRPKLLVTPHILTEVDNFADSLRAAESFRGWLRDEVIGHLFERSVRSQAAARETMFPRLGLADCSAVKLARARRLVVTKDVDLYIELNREQLPVINFHHLRHQAMGLDKEVAAIFNGGSQLPEQDRGPEFS